MSVTFAQAGSPGLLGSPQFVRLKSSDDLAAVSTSGYLNPYALSEGLAINDGDFVFVEASGGHNQIYRATVAAGNIALVALG